MSFNPEKAEGSVLVNLSLVDKKDVGEIVPLITPVFSSGLAHGSLLSLFNEGERVGENIIPDGKIGLGTVCSITFNGALLHAGIPVTSIFGGLLDIHDRAADRFIEIIHYSGTSLDPLEIFITSRMTDVYNSAVNGNGQIGASFREIPSAAREQVMEVDSLLKKSGLGGFLKLGYSSQPLLDVPVGDGRTGMIIAGGLNAVAPLVEKGLIVMSSALSGLIDFSKLFYYEELDERLKKLPS
jgi:repressor of nif and glnA expression